MSDAGQPGIAEDGYMSLVRVLFLWPDQSDARRLELPGHVEKDAATQRRDVAPLAVCTPQLHVGQQPGRELPGIELDIAHPWPMIGGCFEYCRFFQRQQTGLDHDALLAAAREPRTRGPASLGASCRGETCAWPSVDSGTSSTSQLLHLRMQCAMLPMKKSRHTDLRRVATTTRSARERFCRRTVCRP
jgi:hypothetical protein